MQRKILEAADSTSAPFYGPGENGYILLVDHAGGTWQLEQQVPGRDPAEWVYVGSASNPLQFTGNGVLSFYSDKDAVLRLTGGGAGAEAWLYGNDLFPNREVV